MQLHGIRSWEKVALSRLAVITEEFPSALQSALRAMVSLPENGTCDGKKISQSKQLSRIGEYGGRRGSSCNGKWDSRVRSLIVLFTFPLRGVSAQCLEMENTLVFPKLSCV